MRATCLVCTLKRSPEASNSESLAQVVLGALRDEGVETDVVRLADHRIDFGVVSEAVSDGDEWPPIRERILASEILLMAIPTWLGQPSSVAKIALERMDAFLSETREDGKTPIAYNRVAGVVVVGNEDGAHHVIGETNAALNDVSVSVRRSPGALGGHLHVHTNPDGGTTVHAVVPLDPHQVSQDVTCGCCAEGQCRCAA
jgi:multimeric flavodoxin WrbA